VAVAAWLTVPSSLRRGRRPTGAGRPPGSLERVANREEALHEPKRLRKQRPGRGLPTRHPAQGLLRRANAMRGPVPMRSSIDHDATTRVQRVSNHRRPMIASPLPLLENGRPTDHSDGDSAVGRGHIPPNPPPTGALREENAEGGVHLQGSGHPPPSPLPTTALREERLEGGVHLQGGGGALLALSPRTVAISPTAARNGASIASEDGIVSPAPENMHILARETVIPQVIAHAAPIDVVDRDNSVTVNPISSAEEDINPGAILDGVDRSKFVEGDVGRSISALVLSLARAAAAPGTAEAGNIRTALPNPPFTTAAGNEIVEGVHLHNGNCILAEPRRATPTPPHPPPTTAELVGLAGPVELHGTGQRPSLAMPERIDGRNSLGTTADISWSRSVIHVVAGEEATDSHAYYGTARP
jgi:hypothetical protein